MVLESLFTRVPVGLYVLDTGLRIAAANIAAQTMCGGTQERILGRRLTDAYKFSPPGEVEAILRAVLDSGAPCPERVVYVSPRGVSGRPRVMDVSAFLQVVWGLVVLRAAWDDAAGDCRAGLSGGEEAVVGPGVAAAPAGGQGRRASCPAARERGAA
ncbi:PAS domain-containing protein [Streptomyces sp. NPDC050743]|uniref:PAS domain-containing protein n=1 Tax=Streptomyces sp. NPDC050743 TaxID=3365634 RepID=UPI0037AC4143